MDTTTTDRPDQSIDLRYDVLCAPAFVLPAPDRIDGQRMQYEIRTVPIEGDPFDEAHAETVGSDLTMAEAMAMRAELDADRAALIAALGAYFRGEIGQYRIVAAEPVSSLSEGK